MVGVAVHEHLAVLAQRLDVNVIHPVIRQATAIVSLVAGIANHGPQLRLLTVVVTFVVPLVGAFVHVAIDKDGLLMVISLRYMNSQHLFTPHFNDFHILINQQIKVNLLRIVQ